MKKPKFIKDAIVWNRWVGENGAWLRASNLNLVRTDNDEYYISWQNPRVLMRTVYPYEDWMEEYIGTAEDFRKDERYMNGGITKVILKDRYLYNGVKCRYNSAVINGTGVTTGDCVISEVINSELKIYRLTETDENPREWIVQDIDEKIMIERIGNRCMSLSWIQTEDE